MGAILNMFRVKMGVVIARVCLLLMLAVYSSYGGGCNFPEGWTGGWFQSGTPGLIYINSTTMQGKGECAETDSNDKFLVYERNEDCYRCLVIHEKHKYVLQYKETYCGQRDSLSTMCESITGDAALYSMFRKEPRPLPEPCPFHPAPFTFTYSRGSGDCINPPSRAESCTDDSRLLLRYMACPDVPGTESNVEELICLATWKEGSTRYLVGLISQVQRRNSISTDEDMYRCFVYKGQHADKSVTYNIAQSGDATCNGLTSPSDGSRTMKLTNIDDEHNRCHFPSWVVEHHKWFSLDHTHQYHFTTKNATLKIMNEDGSYEEKRLVCHSILEHKDNKLVKLVAHLTRGCESGHVCVRLARREGAVLELQLGAALHAAPHHACADLAYTPHVTLITTSLYPVRCPMLGRYNVLDSLADRRRRRQQLTIDESPGEELAEKPVECVMGQYDSASIGCGAAQDTIEFQSACTSTVYTCYGSWREGNLGLVVAGPARTASRPHAMCFIYTTYVRNESGVAVSYLALSGVARACDRAVLPGVAGDKAYNLTLNGTLCYLLILTCDVSYLALSGVARACDRAVLPGVAGDKAYNLTLNGTLCYLLILTCDVSYLALSGVARACDRAVLPGVAGDKAYNLTLNGTLCYLLILTCDVSYLALSGVARACDRAVLPGVAGDKAYNLTLNGTLCYLLILTCDVSYLALSGVARACDRAVLPGVAGDKAYNLTLNGTLCYLLILTCDVSYLALSGVARACDRAVLPGVAGDKAYNLTLNGTLCYLLILTCDVSYLALSGVARACDRAVLPGVAGDKAYNLTLNGTLCYLLILTCDVSYLALSGVARACDRAVLPGVAGDKAYNLTLNGTLCYLLILTCDVSYLALSGVARACDRAVLPGVAGDKAYNLTLNGTCEQSSQYNSPAPRARPLLALALAPLALLPILAR